MVPKESVFNQSETACGLCARIALRGVSNFQDKSATKVYGLTLFVVRGGGWVSNFQKKAYAKLE